MNEIVETICEKSLDIVIISIAISIVIFISQIGKLIGSKSEEQCVEYYKNNKYILESCEIYRNKLEGLNE